MKLEVGRIDKAHGVRGDVVVSLVTDRVERVAPGSVLYRDDGQTLTVTSSRPHQTRFIVKFVGFDDREDADQARGTTLFAEPLDDPDVLWVHELVGRRVVDLADSELGTVESVEQNPASDLLVLEGGALVPLTFFIEIADDGAVVVDPPDGLFDPIDAAPAPTEAGDGSGDTPAPTD